MKKSKTSSSLPSLQRLVDDLRTRNSALHARVRFLKQQFQREHAVRLAAAERIKELEQLVPEGGLQVDLPDFSRRRGGAGRGKGRNASARGRGSRVARKPSNSSPRKRGAKARA